MALPAIPASGAALRAALLRGLRAALIASGLLAACQVPPPAGSDLRGHSLLDRYDWSRPALHCPLPRELNEISGLAELTDGRLVGHHDNGSSLYPVSCQAQEVAPLTGAGAPLRGDFEALSRRGDSLYLLTSPGIVYRTRLDATGEALAGPLEAQRAPSAAWRQRCGFEGLAVTDHGLYAACKYPRQPLAGRIQLYRYHESAKQADLITVDVQPVLGALGLERLRPSDLAWSADTDSLLVLVGKERVILEVTVDGTLTAWRSLPRRYHRQAEGLALLTDGSLVIADEADGRRPTLSKYPPRPASVLADAARNVFPPQADGSF